MVDDDSAGSRRRRALEEPLDVVADDRSLVVSAEVRNPRHRTRYRVYFPEFPGRGGALCTCPDFALRGFGTCKHLEAAVLVLGAATAPPPMEVPSLRAIRAVWRKVDRESTISISGEPIPLAVRRPGHALVDPGVP